MDYWNDQPKRANLNLKGFTPEARNAEKTLREIFENSTSKLPLQDLCDNGGCPKFNSGSITGLKISEVNQCRISGTIEVAFIEESRTTCSAVTWKDKAKGELNFDIDRGSGDCFVEARFKGRVYDPEEF